MEENICIKEKWLKLIYNEDYQECFVCGIKNDKGLKLEFLYDEDTKEAYVKYSFHEYMQGYKRIIHGGFIFMLMDEVMAKACLYQSITAVSAKSEIRFKKPVYACEEIEVRGKILEIRGRKIKTVARCIDSEGEERASASCLFIRV